MRAATIVLFVVLAFVQGYAASAAADAGVNGQQPSLHNWLMSKITQPAAGASGSVSAPRTAYMYPEPEKDDVCLEVVNACEDTCTVCGNNIRTGVACGMNDHHGDDEDNMFSSLAGQATVGTCQFSSVSEFAISDSVGALSGAQIYCTLSDTAEQCGPPGCGGSVVTGQGEAYITEVITATKPSILTANTTLAGQEVLYLPYCAADAAGRTGQRMIQSPKAQNMLSRFNTITRRTTGSRRQGGGAAAAYVTTVIVYSGPVTLASKTHGRRTHGWVHVTLPYAVFSEALTAAELAAIPSTVPRLDAAMTAQLNKYFFSFDKPHMEY